ncbi:MULTISPECIES: dienelactone hydrolase family protein [unclassified Variovorax]|uniref:dienelactone hydrolase family protein n=1 Tax=unclassified Variovorax TaxID=663243 RepID=UPI001780A477|nr:MULTISPECIES: dienelactone hydrolase family protein [Variovorax]QOF80385.1 dienelactone hydrolase family protein [Variovorax sp. 38R]WPG35382.1 dienelactone hydrolase family protein [Variovorax boronicumulans]
MHAPFRIATTGGSFNAYVARPQKLPAPAIVVIHEVFGVNADMRQTCDELAAQGYLAVCPDLFWRIAPGLDLSDRTQAELAQAQVLYNAFDLDAGVSDIAATVQATRAMPEVTGKIGVVGYCLGGLLAFLTAARARPDATVAYYPGNADKHVREADRIANPLIVHLAQKDEYIPADAQRQIASALNGQSQVQVYSYPGCGHAFARHRGTAYNAEAAALANRRTADFLALHLQPH